MGRVLPGYWAFGNTVGSLVLSSLTEPSWAVMLAWAFAILQLVGTTQVTLTAFTFHICVA